MSEEKECPKIVTGAFIFNNKGELLMGKSPKWNNKYGCIGGHLELNESLLEGLRREIKEETGMEIYDEIEFIGLTEGLNLSEHNKININHRIFLDYKVIAKNGEVVLNNEFSEYKWLPVIEWLKIDEKEFCPCTKSVIEKLEEKIAGENFENLYKRALADYQNLLKQTAKEKMEFAVYANEQMLREILPVYDHLNMAIAHHNGESSDEWITGVKHVVKQFKDVLEKIGVEEIKVKDKKFDHNLMDALSNEETEDKKLDDLVAKEIKAGYKLNGKVIEPAKVIVYKLKK